MAIVRQLIQGKGKRLFSVPPTATVLEALKLMADHDIGAVLVMEKQGVIGIFSERDYARKGLLMDRCTDVPITEMMTSPVYCVGPGDSVEACMAQMTDKHIRHLPVVENGKVIGVISSRDLIESMVEDQKTLIESMESYILGREFNG